MRKLHPSNIGPNFDQQAPTFKEVYKEDARQAVYLVGEDRHVFYSPEILLARAAIEGHRSIDAALGKDLSALVYAVEAGFPGMDPEAMFFSMRNVLRLGEVVEDAEPVPDGSTRLTADDENNVLRLALTLKNVTAEYVIEPSLVFELMDKFSSNEQKTD